MKQKSLYFILALALIACSCATGNYSKLQRNFNTKPTLGGKLYSAAWLQRSAEYKALCIQAYNIATWQIEKLAAERKEGMLPMAIVTDIDETFLDNSPYAVQEALNGKLFDQKTWKTWCNIAQADTLCGALKFFKKAEALGFTVFYITNRNEENRQGTLENLKKFNFPFADDNHLLTLSNTSDKEPRRKVIREKYEIALLLGDNLGDFDSVFDIPVSDSRDNAVQKLAENFGKKFIVLPNPGYGTWEKAMAGGSISIQKIDSVLIHCLKQPNK